METYLVKKVKALGGTTRKIKFISTNGCPDRLVCMNPGADGHHVLIEVKRPKGGKLREAQGRQIAALIEMGFDTYVAHSKESVDQILSDLIRLHSK